MPKILVVEDEPKIQESIEKSFTLEPSFQCVFESDPQRVIPRAIATHPHLILLDIRLPGGDGRQILKSLKDSPALKAIPVIFLTGMSSEGDRAVGLDLGADDYVVKPFGAIELIARIKAVLRRSGSGESSTGILRYQSLVVDPENHSVTLKGKRLRLPPKELDLLVMLVSNSGKALSRPRMIERISTYEADISSRSLDTHIKNLRKKLGPLGQCIETLPKMGYTWTPLA